MENKKTLLHTIFIIFLQYCIADLSCACDKIIDLLDNSKEAIFLKFNCYELTEEDTSFVSNFLSTNASIEILDLSQNFIQVYQWNSILSSLKFNMTVKTLDLSHNNTLSDDIFKFLRFNNTITKLDLSCCKLHEKSIFALSRNLQYNQGLKSLSLHSNRMMNHIQSLSHSIRLHNHIETLDLSSNCINDESKNFIDEILKSRSLKNLNLDFNHLTDETCLYIRDTLSDNQTLEELIMSRNCIKNVGFICIFEILKKNRILKLLAFDRNDIDQKILSYLSDVDWLPSNFQKLQLSFRDSALSDIQDFKQKAKELSDIITVFDFGLDIEEED